MPTNYFAQNTPKQNKNEIVKRLYSSILGRDPDPSALMYYISLPEINENDVRRQMLESEEHKKILDDFKSIPKLKEELEEAKNASKKQDKLVADKQFEIEELNKILSHKSKEIIRIREEMKNLVDEAVTRDKPNHPTSKVTAMKRPSILDAIRQFFHSIRRA